MNSLRKAGCCLVAGIALSASAVSLQLNGVRQRYNESYMKTSMNIRLMTAAAAAMVLCGGARSEECAGNGEAAGAAGAGERQVKLLRINPDAKPIRDISKSSCSPLVGYAGSHEDEDCKTLYETDREATARAFRLAGVRFVRQWQAVWHWQIGAGAKAGFVGKGADRKRVILNPDEATDMKNVFSFYKEYGIKVMLTLENGFCVEKFEPSIVLTGDLEIIKDTICKYIQWIVDNDFTGVVAGLELGNEPYSNNANAADAYAARWTPIVLAIKKIWPEAPLGIALGEYYENDPDVKAIRDRVLGATPLQRKTYFQAGEFNRWSARYIIAMSNCLDRIDHVIYHTYGAETPYSATYNGIQRYRNFNAAFPELKGKKIWITEWRDRSDEDNRSHQRFRETLNKTGFMLMMVAQPDVDGMNLHQLSTLSGAFWMAKKGKRNDDGTYENGTWNQFDGRGAFTRRPNFDDIHKTYLEPGSMGPAMRLMAETFLREPVVIDFGSEKYGSFAQGCSNAVWACSDYYNDVFHRFRQELRKGKRWNEIKPAGDDCEYIVTRGADSVYMSIIAVNYKPVDAEYELKLPANWGASPAYEYRIYDCPEQYLDVHELPGEPPFTRRYGYQTFHPQNRQEMLTRRRFLTIPANSVTAIRIPIGRRNLGKESEEFVNEALKSDEQGSVQFCAYMSGRLAINVAKGNIPAADKGAARAQAEKAMKADSNRNSAVFLCTIKDPTVRKDLRRRFYELLEMPEPAEQP